MIRINVLRGLLANRIAMADVFGPTTEPFKTTSLLSYPPSSSSSLTLSDAGARMEHAWVSDGHAVLSGATPPPPPPQQQKPPPSCQKPSPKKPSAKKPPPQKSSVQQHQRGQAPPSQEPPSSPLQVQGDAGETLSPSSKPFDVGFR